MYQFSQDFIDQCLKHNRSVDKFKRHNCIFEMFITNAKRCHSLIAFTYFNSIICVLKIEFNKVCSAHKTI